MQLIHLFLFIIFLLSKFELNSFIGSNKDVPIFIFNFLIKPLCIPINLKLLINKIGPPELPSKVEQS